MPTVTITQQSDRDLGYLDQQLRANYTDYEDLKLDDTNIIMSFSVAPTTQEETDIQTLYDNITPSDAKTPLYYSEKDVCFASRHKMDFINTNQTVSDIRTIFVLDPADANLVVTIDDPANFRALSTNTGGEVAFFNKSDTHSVTVNNFNSTNFVSQAYNSITISPGEFKKLGIFISENMSGCLIEI